MLRLWWRRLHFLQETGFDTAENEPSEVCYRALHDLSQGWTQQGLTLSLSGFLERGTYLKIKSKIKTLCLLKLNFDPAWVNFD